jgi:hypothetical protein
VLSFVSASTLMLFWVIFLLPFSAHGRTIQYKDPNIQRHNLSCCFIQLWDLVSHITGKTRVEVGRSCQERYEYLGVTDRQEVTGGGGGGRKLNNAALCNLYSSPNIIDMDMSYIRVLHPTVAHSHSHSQMTSRVLRHTAAAMRAHNVLQGTVEQLR